MNYHFDLAVVNGMVQVISLFQFNGSAARKVWKPAMAMWRKDDFDIL